jgi:hypothetical protein
VIFIRTRACIKCKQYVPIHPGNRENRIKVNNFEEKHQGHTIVTLELEEIKGEYANAIAEPEGKPASMEA